MVQSLQTKKTLLPSGSWNFGFPNTENFTQHEFTGTGEARGLHRKLKPERNEPIGLSGEYNRIRGAFVGFFPLS